MIEHITKPWFILTVPSVIAKYFANVFDLLHLTPYSIGHHELLENDNYPQQNSICKILNRNPRSVGGIDGVKGDGELATAGLTHESNPKENFI